MSNASDKWATQLHTALERLKQSEVECARVAANYAKFESIIHKRSTKLQLSEHSESITNKSELESLYKTEPKSAEGVRRKSIKTEQKPRLAASRHGERPTLKKQPLNKKPNEDAVASFEQAQTSQIQKRIKQYCKNNESIEELSRKFVTEKKKFLIHLEKFNSDSWKIQKSRNSVLEKLTVHMNAT
ncbi:hypothetical protein ILUMI_05037 [Ignelater luminosus]|uniref:Uncharacterized protein n=1 Tax=Ignelater luminosus TaxID=2038154 RepID=A0A8K0DD47_IGNLU|nr:hypothetical protein ILUMI_05037 [Ignelater luminosus]